MQQPITQAAPVLLVDDESQILLSFSIGLRAAGITNIVTVDDSRKVMPMLAVRGAAAVVLDLSMPHLTGMELLTEIGSAYPQTPVIVVTATDNLETAVACMKKGAFDYLVKPVEMERLRATVGKAIEVFSLRNEVSSLRHYILAEQLERPAAFAAIVTRSPKMQAIFRYIEAVSPSGQTLLIAGDTGVGKELFARALHEASGRSGQFVAVNIAGLDDAVFSDTLFGHTKGAYTGADQARDGLVAQASRGTLFLDEIGDLTEASQVKLLRLLQERNYLPLGSDAARQSDARIVVATNRNLQELLERGLFRRDLYYRLSTHRVHIPPLAERREDIPLLVDHFLDRAASALGKKRPSYPPELLSLLSVYHFPGNVRELEAMIFDAVAQHQGGVLSLSSFGRVIREGGAASSAAAGGQLSTQEVSGVEGRFPTLHESEEFLIAEALRIAKNNQGIAATLLGISRQALNKRLKRMKDTLKG